MYFAITLFIIFKFNVSLASIDREKRNFNCNNASSDMVPTWNYKCLTEIIQTEFH